LLKLVQAESAEPREPPSEAPQPEKKRGRFQLPDDPNEFRATLVEHLEELRTRIVRSLLFLAAGWIIGWYLEPFLYKLLNDLVTVNIEASLPKGINLAWAFRNAPDAFMLKIKLSFLIGLILALPLIVLQVWGFIRPGLKANERKPIERVAPFSVLLFAMGVGFCCIILGPAVRWFASYLADFPNTMLIQDPGVIISFCLKMMLAFGVGFQLPLIVFALGAMNLLSAQTLVKYWRHASVVIFVGAAILTPSNDAFSMLMMAIPMVILFMISVFAVKATQGRRQTIIEPTDSALDGVENQSD
jgi:sec-independent protein translocase protein TatC